MTQPQFNHPNTEPNPAKPDEGQTLQPQPDIEVNPSIPGNDTEVDLDKNKIETYPGGHPPEHH